MGRGDARQRRGEACAGDQDLQASLPGAAAVLRHGVRLSNGIDRDLCASLGVAMTLEDSWGGDIVTAAIAHLAHSCPPEVFFTATDFNGYVTVSFAEGAPQRTNGRLAASTAPGLGITPKMEVLGKPMLVIE